MVVLMVNDKIHICVIDNGVFCGQVHLYKDMEVIGSEIRPSVSKSDNLSHGSACANVIKKNIKKFEQGTVRHIDNSSTREADVSRL